MLLTKIKVAKVRFSTAFIKKTACPFTRMSSTWPVLIFLLRRDQGEPKAERGYEGEGRRVNYTKSHVYLGIDTISQTVSFSPQNHRNI